MKYKFVIPPNVASKMLDLSEEEVRIVLATVIGHHNAIFWGYKPERLANAVRCLSNNNILMLCDIGRGEQTRLMYGFDIDRQCILVESNSPSSTVICGLVEKFSVVYKCVETEPRGFTSIPTLRVRIEDCEVDRRYWYSTKFIQGKLPTPCHFWFTGDCWDLFRQSETNVGNLAIKFAAVARSLSDIDKSCLTTTNHFAEAKNYYDTGIIW